MDKRKIYLRADGNSSIGLGHVIRSLSLADMLKEQFDIYFIIRNPLPALKEQILEFCKSIIELPETEDDLNEARYISQKYLSGNEIVVLDGYHFITDYQLAIKKKGGKLVCIDDIHSYHFVADVIINHAPGLDSSIYSTEPYTKCCLGLNFSLIRKPFLEAAKKQRTINEIKELFICFGGADFNNLTLKVLKILVNNKIKIEKINIVLGGANIFKEQIVAFITTVTSPKIVLRNNLSAIEMRDLMSECDLAIVPASSILLEILAVKMPVICGYYIDNQENIYNGFNKLGVIYGAGDLRLFDDYPKLLEEVFNSDSNKVIALQSKYQSGDSKTNFLNLFSQLTYNE